MFGVVLFGVVAMYVAWYLLFQLGVSAAENDGKTLLKALEEYLAENSESDDVDVYAFIARWLRSERVFNKPKITSCSQILFSHLSIFRTCISTDNNCCAFAEKCLVSLPRIPFPQTIKLWMRGFFRARKNSCRTCHYEVKCRKTLWLQAREAVWSDWKQTQSSESRFFLRKRNVNCCFARCAAITHRSTNSFILINFRGAFGGEWGS